MKPRSILFVISLIVMLSLGTVESSAQAQTTYIENGLVEGPQVSASNPATAGQPNAWTWYDGGFQFSIVQDCIGGWLTYGMGTWTGFLNDAENYQPAVNSLYYLRIGAYGIGYPCGSIYAYFTFQLPPNTSLAISQSSPMFCFRATSGNWQQFPCGTSLQQIAPGQYVMPSGDAQLGNAWPIAAGVGWEFRFPVVTSTTLNNSQFTGAIRNIDAYQNPAWLYPYVPVYVWPATTPTAPAAFGKSLPGNGATTGVPTNPTLTWNASTWATSYEYCLNTTNTCSSWVSNGNATSKLISGLATNTYYYWHVRAVNSIGNTYSNGSPTAIWSFRTSGVATPPGAFDKSSPANAATGISTSPTLSWGASIGANPYEYCINTSVTCSNWIGNGTATSVALSNLTTNTTYYWHVRSRNGTGTTYSNGLDTAFWSFRTSGVATLPGAFDKSSPANAATGILTSPTLSWGTSSGATSYEYCYNTSNTCSSWASNGTATSVALSNLTANTTYYWHVRSRNFTGITYSNGAEAAIWSFKTMAAGESKYVFLPVTLK